MVQYVHTFLKTKTCPNFNDLETCQVQLKQKSTIIITHFLTQQPLPLISGSLAMFDPFDCF